MALSNYTELQTAIQNELRRDDLSTKIPDFIKRAEAKINRRCRLREQEQLSESTYDTSVTTKRIALPTNFLELLDFKIKESSAEDTDFTELRFIVPGDFHKYRCDAGRPVHYTLRDQIEFDRAADTTYTVRMHYLKRWDIATDETNWLLTNYPDAYLYGSMCESLLYIKDDKRVPMWTGFFMDTLNELNRLDERSRNDAVLDTSEFSNNRDYYGYRILTDGY